MLGNATGQFFQALEKGSVSFSKAWKKHHVRFPILGNVQRKGAPRFSTNRGVRATPFRVTTAVHNLSLTALQGQARAGSAAAQFTLGKFYTRLDPGLVKDLEHQRTALKWFLAAAEQGHAEAQHQLGLILAWGPEALRDDAQALVWLRQAAERNQAGAWIDLGWLLQRRSENYAEVIHCFEQALALGSAAGHFSLGVFHEHVPGDASALSKALHVSHDAAQLDRAPVQRELGQDLLESSGGHPSARLKEAVACYRRAAELGDADGQYKVGTLYEHGRSLPQDVALAAEFYRLAAVQGHGLAQAAVGRLYRAGRGVAQDLAGALQWFRKAATLDPLLHAAEVAEAQNALGEMYLSGQGVEQDLPTALKLFMKAARGNPTACVNLGTLFFEGKLVPCDYVKAKNYFSKAALAGNAEAGGWLARLKTIRLRPTRKPGASVGKTEDSDQDQLQLGLL